MKAQEPTVGQGDDLAWPFGLSHPPDIFYGVGLAFTGLSTEVVGEVSILDGAWDVIGDPLSADVRVLDIGLDDGGERKLDAVEVDLDEGEGDERGEEESH